MITIPAGEANRHFSKVLRQAAQGETIVITSRGKPVATLGPSGDQEGERNRARQALLARLSTLKPTGVRTWKREDLYEVPA